MNGLKKSVLTTILLLLIFSCKKDLSTDYKKTISYPVYISTIAVPHTNWMWQYPKPQGNTLNSVFTINENEIWAAGEASTILHSKDGGKNWSVKSFQSEESFFDIFFLNENIGWLAGTNGIIFNTLDGGESWQSQLLDVNNWVISIYFIDENNGWAVGYDGLIANTINGGETWHTSFYSGATWFYCVYFQDINHGWIVGDKGTILYTDNGGKTWDKQSSGTTEKLDDICFIENKGWIAGHSGVVLSSANNGKSWHQAGNTNSNRNSSIFFTDQIMAGLLVGGRIIFSTQQMVGIPGRLNQLMGLKVFYLFPLLMKIKDGQSVKTD